MTRQMNILEYCLLKYGDWTPEELGLPTSVLDEIFHEPGAGDKPLSIAGRLPYLADLPRYEQVPRTASQIAGEWEREAVARAEAEAARRRS
jgi:hypothetical protein